MQDYRIALRRFKLSGCRNAETLDALNVRFVLAGFTGQAINVHVYPSKPEGVFVPPGLMPSLVEEGLL